jgi:hypothetical protein
VPGVSGGVGLTCSAVAEKKISKRQPERNYEARVDPDGSHRRLSNGMALLASGPGGWVLKKLGVDAETLASARAAPARFAELVGGLETVAQTLAPLGWIAFGAMPTEEYQRAARLAAAGDSDAAEELLMSAWEQRLELALQPLRFLYEDESRSAIGHGRLVIMREALENYAAGRYASAVMLTLSQIDGIVFDMTGKDARSFFASGAKAAHLRDEQTLAGHPSGLAVLARLFNKDRRQTSVEGDLRRHGIMHGRELEFGSKRNAIKTFVALFSVIEWARPIAETQTARLRSEREQRYAGSEETDEDGRRLDRRGFDRVQRALETIELYQHTRFDRAGYARDARELEANDEFSSITGIEMTVSSGGQSFRAWAPTEGGIVFGVAGERGDQIGWRYQGSCPPPEDVSGHPGWRHLLEDEPHPDW